MSQMILFGFDVW